MNEIADRYRTRAARLTDLCRAVPEDRWDAPSPCQAWTAHDVLVHVVDTEHDFLARFDRADGLPPSDADALAAWDAVRERMQAILDDRQAAATSYEGYFGPTTLAQTIDGFFSSDLVVHGWDIARATGLAAYESIPEDEVERALAAMRELPEEALRAPEVFGPEIEVGDDADPQTRLLAFLGRAA